VCVYVNIDNSVSNQAFNIVGTCVCGRKPKKEKTIEAIIA